MKETPQFGATEHIGHSSFTLDWQSFGKKAATCIGTLYQEQARRDPRFRKNVKNAQDMKFFLTTLVQEAYYPQFPETTTLTIPENRIIEHGESFILEAPAKQVIKHIRTAVDSYRRSPNPHFKKKEKMSLKNFSHGLAILESFVREPWIKIELTAGSENVYTVQKMTTAWILGTHDHQR